MNNSTFFSPFVVFFFLVSDFIFWWRSSERFVRNQLRWYRNYDIFTEYLGLCLALREKKRKQYPRLLFQWHPYSSIMFKWFSFIQFYVMIVSRYSFLFGKFCIRQMDFGSIQSFRFTNISPRNMEMENHISVFWIVAISLVCINNKLLNCQPDSNTLLLFVVRFAAHWIFH